MEVRRELLCTFATTKLTIMKVHVLTIGLNYTGTDNALPGCENDAKFWTGLFAGKFDNGKNIYTSAHYTKATDQTIVDFVKQSSRLLGMSDLFIFQYSGHGTRENTPEGHKEALVLYDGNDYSLMYDETLRELLGTIKGTVLIVLDSCFSGGMTRLIQRTGPNMPAGARRKFIPFDPAWKETAVHSSIRGVRSVAKSGSVLYMLACEENQTALDLGDYGAFTKGCMTAILKKKKRAKTITMTAADIVEAYQNPVYIQVGKKKDIELVK